MSSMAFDIGVYELPEIGTSRQLEVDGFHNLNPEQQRAKIRQLREQYYPETKKLDHLRLCEKLQKLVEQPPKSSTSSPHEEESNDQSSTSSTLPPGQEEANEQNRALDRQVRELLQQDCCLPVIPEKLSFPYLPVERASLPDVNRGAFAFFAPEDAAEDGFISGSVLARQGNDWVRFREWQRGKKVNHWIECVAYMEKRLESLREGRIKKNTQVEDLMSYQDFHKQLREEDRNTLQKCQDQCNRELDATAISTIREGLQVKIEILKANIARRDRLLLWIKEIVQSTAATELHACQKTAAKVANICGNAAAKRKRSLDEEDVTWSTNRRKRKKSMQQLDNAILSAQRLTRSKRADPTQFYELDFQSRFRQQKTRPSLSFPRAAGGNKSRIRITSDTCVSGDGTGRTRRQLYAQT